MNKECLGCGSVLQTESPGKGGFVKSSVYDKSSYCERCFKIKHYGEYSVLDKKIDTDGIIRNILYSGVWMRMDAKYGSQDDGSAAK